MLTILENPKSITKKLLEDMRLLHQYVSAKSKIAYKDIALYHWKQANCITEFTMVGKLPGLEELISESEKNQYSCLLQEDHIKQQLENRNSLINPGQTKKQCFEDQIIDDSGRHYINRNKEEPHAIEDIYKEAKILRRK